MRTGYYRDMWSKMLCDTAVTAWWDAESQTAQDKHQEDLVHVNDQIFQSHSLHNPTTSRKPIERGPLHLSKMRLSRLYHTEYMFAVTELDVSHNYITNFAGFISFVCLTQLNISHNKLTTLSGIEVCGKLVSLDAGNNEIQNACGILPCTKCPNLKRLTLAGNPLTKSPRIYPACVKESCLTLCELDGVEL